MKRLLVLCIVLSFFAASAVTAQQGGDPGGKSSRQASGESPLLRLLSFVPDTPANREWVAFGDMAAWSASWGVPRPNSMEDWNALPRDPHAYWMFIMPRQTAPPNVLGLQYMMMGDMRPFYGFDVFNVDRFIEAGMPPDSFTVVEYAFDNTQIATALTASGYQSSALDDTATLYSLLGDNESPFSAGVKVPRAGQFGELNRIVLLSEQMIIGRATDTVTQARAAEQGQTASLAGDPVYAAAVQALADSSLADTGDLLGTVLLPGTSSAFGGDPALLLSGAQATPEEIAALRARLAEQYGPDPLPAFSLVAFATRHAPGATTLTLAVVFPAGTDAGAASGIIAYRLQNYTSLTMRQPLTDRWTFDRAVGVTANNLPVALVTMRIDDPPVAPEGEQANAGVLSWYDLIVRRDLGFLLVGTLAQ